MSLTETLRTMFYEQCETAKAALEWQDYSFQRVPIYQVMDNPRRFLDRIYHLVKPDVIETF